MTTAVDRCCSPRTRVAGVVAMTGDRAARRELFDVGRLAAAAAIIWLHTPAYGGGSPTRLLTRFAVPFFVLATVFFVFDSLRRHPQRTFGAYVPNRVARIYLPFLGWSVIYLAFKGLKKLLLPDLENDFPGLEVLWEGSFYHLWFMPFILVVSVATFPVAKAAVGARGTWVWVLSMLCLAEALLLSWVALSVQEDSYRAIVLNALPAVFLGIALAAPYDRVGRWLEGRCGMLAGVALFTVCSLLLWEFGRDRLLETLAGLGFFLMVLPPVGGVWISRLGRFGALAYGIYLSHLLFIKVAEAVGMKLVLSPGPGLELAIWLFTLTGSAALAWMLTRSRYGRWLVA